MRILTVSHFYESHGGGIERVAGRLCRELDRLGVASVWAASDGDDVPDGNVQTVPLSCVNPTERLTGLPMPIPRPSGYRALAREVPLCDAVIIHDALYVTSILALLLAKKHGKRVILVQHIAAIPFASPALRAIMRLANHIVTGPMLRAADSCVFISDTVRRELLGEPASRAFELIFNGVDRTTFHLPLGSAEAPVATAGFDIRQGRRRVLFVGRYVEKKGLSVLRELAATRPDLEFFLVGVGPIRPRDWCLDNVHDLGPRNQDEVASLYRWADLLLLPSVGEGYPLVIQEAMACGLPVICGEPTDRADPNAARWIRGVPITLANPNESSRRCSETIDGFALDEAARHAMARYASEHYDWREMAARLLSIASLKS